MKVLFVHNFLWAHYKSTVFAEVHRQAAQYGVTAHVLQIARNERGRAQLGGFEKKPDLGYSYELLFDSDIEDVSLGRRTRALLGRMLRFRPDVLVLTGWYDPAQLALLLLARLRGTKVIIQNESTAQDHVRKGAREWLKRRIVGMANGFFCFGTPAANYLLALGVRPEQILVRHNAVVDSKTLRRSYDRALPGRTDRQQALGLKPHNVIYVGRFAPTKNLPTLLTAFASAREASPTGADWGLLLLGDGDQKPALQKQVAQLGLDECVRFLPGAPWYEVPEWLALADLLVLPSLSEPWGLVVNEAMVCSLPVLVSDHCGCAQDLVRPGENGYVFPPNDLAALRGHLIRLMHPETDREAMGRQSAQMIESYSPPTVAAEMLRSFVHLAGDRRSS